MADAPAERRLADVIGNAIRVGAARDWLQSLIEERDPVSESTYCACPLG
jgi:hypothetical protein